MSDQHVKEKHGAVKLFAPHKVNAQVSFHGFRYPVRFDDAGYAEVADTFEFAKFVKPYLAKSGITIAGRVAPGKPEDKPAQTVKAGKAAAGAGAKGGGEPAPKKAAAKKSAKSKK